MAGNSPQRCRPAWACNRLCALPALVMASFLVLSTAQCSKQVKRLQWYSHRAGRQWDAADSGSPRHLEPRSQFLVSVADVREGPPSFSRSVCECKSAAAELPCTPTCKVGKRVGCKPSRVRIPHPPPLPKGETLGALIPRQPRSGPRSQLTSRDHRPQTRAGCPPDRRQPAGSGR